MRRLALALVALASLMAGVLTPPAASAAKKKVKRPQVTSVTPMRLKAGRTLTIRGRNFSSRRRRNTVVFVVGRRSIFAKPSRASSRRLVVKAPLSLERFMSRDNRGARRPTRFALQVAVRSFSRKTPRRLSPVVLPLSTAPITLPSAPITAPSDPGSGEPDVVDCDRDGVPNVSDTSSDFDLLSDATERTLRTDPCKVDTDADGVEDGWEYQSALDLNHYPTTPPLPYPGKRPYPNPLDPSDAGTDYDGDSLNQRAEFLMWLRFLPSGARRSGRPTRFDDFPGSSDIMSYSDGLQKSVASPRPLLPADPRLRWAVDEDGDAFRDDDERDGDGDRLNNYDELRGHFTEAWWVSFYNGTNAPKESKYPEIDFLDNEDVGDGFADPDIDGDGVLDGEDDHDHDGLTNEFEVHRGASPAWGYTQPFNPCKPFNSERCHKYVPFGYYDGDGSPPVGPDPPANHHLRANQPDTPNGP